MAWASGLGRHRVPFWPVDEAPRPGPRGREWRGPMSPRQGLLSVLKLKMLHETKWLSCLAAAAQTKQRARAPPGPLSCCRFSRSGRWVRTWGLLVTERHDALGRALHAGRSSPSPPIQGASSPGVPGHAFPQELDPVPSRRCGPPPHRDLPQLPAGRHTVSAWGLK